MDFVVYGQTQFAAIEVKNSNRVRSTDLRGRKSFRDDDPECKPMLLYHGEDKLEVDASRVGQFRPS